MTAGLRQCARRATHLQRLRAPRRPSGPIAAPVDVRPKRIRSTNVPKRPRPAPVTLLPRPQQPPVLARNCAARSTVVSRPRNPMNPVPWTSVVQRHLRSSFRPAETGRANTAPRVLPAIHEHTQRPAGMLLITGPWEHGPLDSPARVHASSMRTTIASGPQRRYGMPATMPDGPPRSAALALQAAYQLFILVTSRRIQYLRLALRNDLDDVATSTGLATPFASVQPRTVKRCDDLAVSTVDLSHHRRSLLSPWKVRCHKRHVLCTHHKSCTKGGGPWSSSDVHSITMGKACLRSVRRPFSEAQ
ncbi:hypothetical protein BDU57DRAFT_573534 [Ampelomyces quisqualis]|uniref:Uncharacterized protein n=1 Tax=Ampelomyces quisqualis TaxID=50730 RepID=A0A6A5QMJ0_AMPQU|nr:hypothetical protein BDU57DRAFT_573534 [Ampelomyces quisqualis]